MENINTQNKLDAISTLSSQQIEGIEFMQIGDIFPKRLKQVEILHPMQNVHGLMRIGEAYYKWVIDTKASK
jgi:hypothetical protein